MGSWTCLRDANEGTESASVWSVEGGPLMVSEWELTALMYASFNVEMFYICRVRTRTLKPWSQV